MCTRCRFRRLLRIAIRMLFASLIFVAFANSQTQQETQELAFPQMVVGGGWECELTIVAQGADTSTGLVLFIGQNGGAMAVSVDGGVPVTSFGYSLIYRSIVTYKLTSAGGTRVGWIFVGNKFPINRGSINGLLTYRYKPTGVVAFQIGVLPSKAISKGHLPFDNTNGNKTALALAMSGIQDTVNFARYNKKGEFLESTSRPFQPWSQQALYVDELFPKSINESGFLMISCSAPFNALALNDNSGNFSTTAVLPAVFERELTISVGDLTNCHVRLTREGNFFTGIADRITPPAVTNPISGTIAALPSGAKLLQLTIASFYVSSGRPLFLTLVATVPDENLQNVTGTVYMSNEYGQSVTVGTFTLYALSMAQF